MTISETVQFKGLTVLVVLGIDSSQHIIDILNGPRSIVVTSLEKLEVKFDDHLDYIGEERLMASGIGYEAALERVEARYAYEHGLIEGIQPRIDQAVSRLRQKMREEASRLPEIRESETRKCSRSCPWLPKGSRIHLGRSKQWFRVVRG